MKSRSILLAAAAAVALTGAASAKDLNKIGVTLGTIVSVLEAPVADNLVGVAFKSSTIAVNANLTVTYMISEGKS